MNEWAQHLQEKVGVCLQEAPGCCQSTFKQEGKGENRLQMWKPAWWPLLLGGSEVHRLPSFAAGIVVFSEGRGRLQFPHRKHNPNEHREGNNEIQKPRPIGWFTSGLLLSRSWCDGLWGPFQLFCFQDLIARMLIILANSSLWVFWWFYCKLPWRGQGKNQNK